MYEVMEISEELRELILVGASGPELRRKAIDDGMITLRESGLYKIRAGLVTIEEVVREAKDQLLERLAERVADTGLEPGEQAGGGRAGGGRFD